MAFFCVFAHDRELIAGKTCMKRALFQPTWAWNHSCIQSSVIACRWQQAILASVAAILAACVIVSVVTVAQSTALLATDMTLSKGLLKAGKVRSRPKNNADEQNLHCVHALSMSARRNMTRKIVALIAI